MPATRLLALALFLAPLAASAQQPNLTDTIKKLDQASARFQSAEAHVHRVFYNAVIKAEDDVQDGSIYFQREKAGTQMGLATTGKGARIVMYKSGTVRVYNPGLKCYDAVTKPGIETYLTLGFGGSGTDLDKAWAINDLGSEKIDGTTVEKLELTPKDPAVKSTITKFTIWIDLTRGVSLKQVLLDPSRNLQTATYTHVKLNEKIDPKPYNFGGKACGK